MSEQTGFAGRLARGFINNHLTPIFILGAIFAGIFATIVLPREEEPQIVVPMIDIFVGFPGGSPKEVEERISKPMEKLLWEIKGVKYIYSTSMPGQSLVIVRFRVGQSEENSLVKVYHKLYSHLDMMPPGATQPLIRMRTIYDVPILALTLWGKNYDSFRLRRIASQIICQKIRQVRDVNAAKIIGGLRRQIKVVLDPTALAAHNVTPNIVFKTLQSANQQVTAGSYDSDNRDIYVRAGRFLRSKEDVAHVVVGVFGGHPVYLQDVARVEDGPQDPSDYVYFAAGPAAGEKQGWAIPKGTQPGDLYPAVTIEVAKHKSANAINVVDHIIAKVKELQRTVLPSDLHITITRNYGRTANQKSNELLEHMLIAVVSVSVLIGFALGWREAGVVALAVPTTLALTLVVLSLWGYTLNRVTLFALVFSIGILVDDAIVVVENIVRHYRLPSSRGRSLVDVAVEAVNEVGNPTILATFTVVASILPMAFVRGLMGPYMRPIPVGATAAMLFSMMVAFIVSPWAALRLLGRGGGHQKVTTTEHWSMRLYRRFMRPLIYRRKPRAIFLFVVFALFVVAVLLVPLKIVRVKMLPFDNKSEFQVIVKAPEGYTLERTGQAMQAMADYISTVPEVTDDEVYVGTASPYNFNGLVRHYYLRHGPNVGGIQVNLVDKSERHRESHAIAKAVRPGLDKIAKKYGVRVTVAEVPPGPPVLQTLVAEVYGPNYNGQIKVARQVENVFRHTPGVVDIDDYIEAEPTEYHFNVDKAKAQLNGITTKQVVNTLRIALHGMSAGLAHIPTEAEPCDIFVRLPRADRSSVNDLLALRVMSSSGQLVPLREVVDVKEGVRQRNIYRKNLHDVVYVVADVAGAEESPVYAILKMYHRIGQIVTPDGGKLKQISTHLPFYTDRYVMKWDGEWQITYEVFRDLGIAFAVVLLVIYALVVGWFQSFWVPLSIMTVIPLSLIGILPAHAAMGAFFTATSMIGFIAGAGIVVRNSIILVDFIELRLREGMSLGEACIDAGAVRSRPIILTAAAVFVGSSVILLDPIFQGMAISLMAGELAAVIFSLPSVPLLYFLQERHKYPNGGTTPQPGGPSGPAGPQGPAGPKGPEPTPPSHEGDESAEAAPAAQAVEGMKPSEGATPGDRPGPATSADGTPAADAAPEGARAAAEEPAPDRARPGRDAAGSSTPEHNEEGETDEA